MTKMHSLNFYLELLNLNLNSHTVLVSIALGTSHSLLYSLYSCISLSALISSYSPLSFQYLFASSRCLLLLLLFFNFMKDVLQRCRLMICFLAIEIMKQLRIPLGIKKYHRVLHNSLLQLFSIQDSSFCSFPGSSAGEESAYNAGDPVRFLGEKDPLEKGQTTHSSILGLPWWLSW